MEDKKYNLKNDIIFKAFFSRKGNEEFLKDFLNALLGIEIESIKIKEEVNLEQLSAMEKGGRLDLQATLNERQIVNIELQSKDRGNFKVRTVFYASKIISREVVKGTDYDDLDKTIFEHTLLLDWKGNQKNIEPDSEIKLSSTPIFLIQNTGDYSDINYQEEEG